MKNKTKYIISILFIAFTLLLINPTNVFADNTGNCTKISSGSPTISGYADVSGSVERTIGSNVTGSNYYWFGNSRAMCITGTLARPTTTGDIYECTNTSVYNGGHDGLDRLERHTYGQIAYSLTNYTFGKSGNDYIIGHAILSGVIGGDWGIYQQLYSNIATRELVDNFMNGVSIGGGNPTYYVYRPSENNQQVLLMLLKPPILKGGVAARKQVNGSYSDNSGYQFNLYSNSSCTGSYVTLTTDSQGYVEYWGEGGSSSNPQLPLGQSYCFKEVVDGNGYAIRNGQSTTYKPSGSAVVTSSTNPKATGSYGVINNSNSPGKGGLAVHKITTDNSPVDGYNFFLFSNGDCSGNPTSEKQSGFSGTVEWDNLDPGTYCIMEKTSGGYATRYDSATIYKPYIDGVQTDKKTNITVSGITVDVLIKNGDTPPPPQNPPFCLRAWKVMQEDDGSWTNVMDVPLRLTHYSYLYGWQTLPPDESLNFHGVTSETGAMGWAWTENEILCQDNVCLIREYGITEGDGSGAANWHVYRRGDNGANTPYIYGVSSTNESGPHIGHAINFAWLDEPGISLRSNNWGIPEDGTLPHCDQTPMSPAVTLVNTKVYFCLRVKKEDENGEKIDPNAFNDMVFEATGNGRTIRTTDTSVSSINHDTGVVSFFIGDSIQAGVTTDGVYKEIQKICNDNGQICSGPDNLVPADWQVREISAPTGYTVNTEKVLTVKPTQMKAYYWQQTDDENDNAYQRAKADCLSGGTEDGETFSPYVKEDGIYHDADHYTKINDLTVDNPDPAIKDQYVIKNKKLVLQWFKKATNDPDTTPNDEALLNGAKFIARRHDGGVDGKAYAKIKDLDGNGQITLADRQLTKDANGVEKLCYLTDGYQAAAPNVYMESADVSPRQDGSMPGEVCIANVNASKNDPNYVITEIDSADSHTFGSNKEKTISTTKFFVSISDANTILNYSTEFEFLKKATAYDQYTNEELSNISFSIYRQNNQGQATGDPISLKVAGNGVYDYLRGSNPTTILHVRASDLKFVVKHLPKGKYIVKEMVGSTCEDNTDPSTCIGYYMPTSNDQKFTITNCSSLLASSCGNGNYRRETANVINTPTEIKFTKSDFYHEFDAGDVAEQGNNVPSEFANDKERSDFDRIVFTLYDKNGTPLKLQFVGNHGDCSSDNDYAEYRYVRGGTVGSTELHTCGGHIRITHLCRGRTYTVKEESVPENSVFVKEATDSTPTQQTYKVGCNEDDATRATSETKLIVDKPTRVTFEKRDAKYNYLIPDETTTFEVYKCAKGQTCHPSDYTSVESREAAGMELIKFSPRGVISGDEEDPGVEVYKYMSFSDAKNKSKCQGTSTRNCYVTDVHPQLGKLIFRYLPSGYNYVLLETVAPKNYLLPAGIKAETSFTVRNDTVSVDYIDVPNQPTGILIRKYDDEGRLLGGAKFRVKKVTNYNPNKKAQDQESVDLKFKTIKQGVYEYRPVLDSDIVITCEGAECSNTDAFSYDKNWSNFDTLLTSSGEMIKDVLKEGTAIIQYLEYDNYYVIEEVEAPKGHSLPEREDDRYTLIHIGKNTTIIEDTEMEFVNYPTPYTFYKFDEYNSPLDGAKFKLQKLNDNKSYVTINVSKVEGEASLYKVDPESNNDIIETTNGKATVYYLEEGQYRIVEVEAAPGKELPKKTINVATFFVDKDGNVFGDNIITNKAPTPRKIIKPQAKANLIINIQTGQSVVRYGLIIAVLIAAITGLMIFIKKRK